MGHTLKCSACVTSSLKSEEILVKPAFYEASYCPTPVATTSRFSKFCLGCECGFCLSLPHTLVRRKAATILSPRRCFEIGTPYIDAKSFSALSSTQPHESINHYSVKGLTYVRSLIYHIALGYDTNLALIFLGSSRADSLWCLGCLVFLSPCRACFNLTLSSTPWLLARVRPSRWKGKRAFMESYH